MENKNIYEETKSSRNKIIAIAIYVLFFFILSALITYLVAMIYSNINNVDYNQIKASYTLKSDEFKNLSIEIKKANAITQGYANLLIYLLTGIIIIFLTRKDIKSDLFELKNKSKFYLWFIPVAVVSFVLICFVVDLIFKNIIPSSENQLQIENILTNGGMLPMAITTLFLAPIVEELIFRKCIFSLCGKNRIVLAYIVSIILFVFPHMLTTTSSVGIWFLQAIPYVVAAGLFATIYHLSGFNVYVTLLAHIANNGLALILVFTKG